MSVRRGALSLVIDRTGNATPEGHGDLAIETVLLPQLHVPPLSRRPSARSALYVPALTRRVTELEPLVPRLSTGPGRERKLARVAEQTTIVVRDGLDERQMRATSSLLIVQVRCSRDPL
jgi:hypothetical protein